MNGLKSAAVVTTAIILACAITAWLIVGDPVSQAKWDQVREGMTREQVMKIMGKPRSHDGTNQIEYSRILNAGWVEFLFNGKDTLVEKNDESVFGSLR